MDENATSAHTQGNGQAVSVNMVGFDKPFLTAIAIVLSIAAMIFAYMALHEAQADEYWLQRNEAFLEQLSAQGVRVPGDLLTHKEKHP